jgi:hypothetical protein
VKWCGLAHTHTHLFDTDANKSNIQERLAAITSTLGRLLSGALVNVLYFAPAAFALNISDNNVLSAKEIKGFRIKRLSQGKTILYFGRNETNIKG